MGKEGRSQKKTRASKGRCLFKKKIENQCQISEEGFDDKKCKKQPFRGKRASQKKRSQQGRIEKIALEKKGRDRKKNSRTIPFFLALKKGVLESNMLKALGINVPL